MKILGIPEFFQINRLQERSEFFGFIDSKPPRGTEFYFQIANLASSQKQ